jgi:Domain of unknown function (DUF4252)
MKFHRLSLAAPLLSLALLPISALAQEPEQWVPQGIESLGHNASARTDFSLDKSMLQFAQKIDNSDPETQRVIAGLDAIAVHSYHFSAPGMYDPAALDALREQYHAAGWQHMVSSHHHDDGTGQTELWIHFHGATVTNMSVLLASPTQLNFVVLSGTVRPLDLLHLSGHFGIPKFDNDSYVRAPDDRR